MGHEHHRGGVVFGDASEQLHQLLATSQIESRRRLVQDEQRWVVDERACEQDTLALAGRQCGESGVGETREAESFQQRSGAGTIRIVVLMPARRQRGMPAGHDDVRRPQSRSNHVRERVAGDPEPRAERADIGPAESLAEHVEVPPGRMDIQAGHPTQRGLSRAVRADNDPPLAAGDAPVDVGQNGAAVAHEIDAGERDH